LRVRLLLVGVIIAVVLMTVLVTWFVGPIPSSQTTGLARISDIPALNPQANPAQPERGDPTPGTPSPSPVILIDSQDTSKLSPQTIIDY
jgi:hypothetical protein